MAPGDAEELRRPQRRSEQDGGGGAAGERGTAAAAGGGVQHRAAGSAGGEAAGSAARRGERMGLRSRASRVPCVCVPVEECAFTFFPRLLGSHDRHGRD